MTDRNRRKIMTQMKDMFEVGERFTTEEGITRLNQYKPKWEGSSRTYTKKYIPSMRELSSWLGRNRFFVRVNVGEQPAEWERTEEGEDE